MPIYEYISLNKCCEHCESVFEISQSIYDEPIKKCPECGAEVKKIISLPAGFIMKGREANQYADVKKAKYWRDKNGVRHRVTDADGSSHSPTVSRRQTASPQEVELRKQIDKKKDRERMQKRGHPWLRKKKS